MKMYGEFFYLLSRLEKLWHVCELQERRKVDGPGGRNHWSDVHEWSRGGGGLAEWLKQ
jgi:hypothetical protein